MPYVNGAVWVGLVVEWCMWLGLGLGPGLEYRVKIGVRVRLRLGLAYRVSPVFG